ncbi:hypothetical protein MRX96_042453 [Rhipicephalus microplus]
MAATDSTRTLRYRWENVNAYGDRLWPSPTIRPREPRGIRRSHLLMLMAVIVSGPFLLGCLIYRMRGLDDEGNVFEFVEPSASTNAYNDRVGRAVEPHARWVEHGHRWQSPQRGLRLFSAHYRHELRSFSEPIIRVLALATAEFLDSCLVRARIVYRDYPNSIPTGRVTCRQLSRSSEGAERNTSQRLHDAILEVATGQPDDRASFVDPLRESDSIAVCIHVDSGNAERASDLASWYRSRGSGQVTAYGVAKRSAGVQGAFVWWRIRALVRFRDALRSVRRHGYVADAPRLRAAFFGDVQVRGPPGRRRAASRRFAGISDRLLLALSAATAAMRKLGNGVRGTSRWRLYVRRIRHRQQRRSGKRTVGAPCAEEAISALRQAERRGNSFCLAWTTALLSGSTAVESASFLPPSIAVLRSSVSSGPNGQTGDSEIGRTSS